MTITLSSWNINGIRAVSAKEGFDWFRNTDYDVIGFQETKASTEQLSDDLKINQAMRVFSALQL